MVRVNLVKPELLSDQHLVAEYDEILMLTAYIKKYPSLDQIPVKYCLGKGHMRFFKDKLIYLKKRHEDLKIEMQKRNFQTNKTINLTHFKKINKNDWQPKKEDYEIIKKRIIEKLNLKPTYYRYYGQYKGKTFFIRILITGQLVNPEKSL
jgi:deoxyribonuclease (pyrimidine dimer)